LALKLLRAVFNIPLANILHPTLLFIDGGALFNLTRELLGIEGHILRQIHSLGKLILYKRGIQRSPCQFLTPQKGSKST
jgi:hypothetical protein